MTSNDFVSLFMEGIKKEVDFFVKQSIEVIGEERLMKIMEKEKREEEKERKKHEKRNNL